MPNIALINDQCQGNNQGGYVFVGDPSITAPSAIASMNDDVLVWGLTNIPPTGVREISSIPTKFTPNGTPIEWFITEYGTILDGNSKVLSSKSQPVAFNGSKWASSHFNGTVMGTSPHQV